MTTQSLIKRAQLNQASKADLAGAIHKNITKNSSLNAFISSSKSLIHQQFNTAKKDAPLYGVSLAVKDNIHVAGIENSAGTPSLKDFIPVNDATVIKALADSGAIIAGKANMHELAFGITSANAYFGTVENPVAKGYLAGGSSGGTASAIAAGLVDAGLGTDTGGSVRIPASLTGICGFRPSIGRYPSDGVTMICPTRDTIGPMAKTTQDLITLDRYITGDTTLPEVDIETVRVGISHDIMFNDLDPHTAKACDKAVQRLTDAGVTFVACDLKQIHDLTEASGFAIVFYESVRSLKSYLKTYKTRVSFDDLIANLASPDVQGVFAAAMGEAEVSDQDYQTALQQRKEAQELYHAMMADNNIACLLSPCTPLPARPTPDSLETVSVNGTEHPTFNAYIRNTDMATVLGIPAIGFPARVGADQLPVGIDINGIFDEDKQLLAVADCLSAIASS